MSAQTTPVLLDGIRTPFGRYLGALASVDPRDLTAKPIAHLLSKYPGFASNIDGVILGVVLQSSRGQNPARLAASTAGVSWDVPAITLNSVCLAGLASVADAARRIRLGEGQRYIVGGGDSMSRAPHAGLLRQADKRPGSIELIDTLVSDGLWCGLTDEGMGGLSDRANAELGITRDDQDNYAVASHQRAAAAAASGFLGGEIVPIVVDGAIVDRDEGIRPDTNLDKLSSLPPAFTVSGSITAANASQMTDGASTGLVCSLAAAESAGFQPLAHIIAWSEIAGPDNTLHLKPARAIRRVLERGGIGLNAIDVIEINEAFAGVALASCRELGLSDTPINMNGGAIALGHPLGGTGFRLLLTAARELARIDGRYAIASMCGGGGQGYAVLIERKG